jgi:hypothetical protein
MAAKVDVTVKHFISLLCCVEPKKGTGKFKLMRMGNVILMTKAFFRFFCAVLYERWSRHAMVTDGKLSRWRTSPFWKVVAITNGLAAGPTKNNDASRSQLQVSERIYGFGRQLALDGGVVSVVVASASQHRGL